MRWRGRREESTIKSDLVFDIYKRLGEVKPARSGEEKGGGEEPQRKAGTEGRACLPKWSHTPSEPAIPWTPRARLIQETAGKRNVADGPPHSPGTNNEDRAQEKKRAVRVVRILRKVISLQNRMKRNFAELGSQ